MTDLHELLKDLSRDPKSWTKKIRTELSKLISKMDIDDQDLVERLLVPLMPYYERLRIIYPRLFSKSFAPYHEDFWTWMDLIQKGKKYPAFIAIWPRGGGKSSVAEACVPELGGILARKYCWYVRETQGQSDKSVENISDLLESNEVARYYPEMSERELGKYGRSKGWRRNRLSTASGFVVDGMGLDQAVRGIKDMEQRPDLIIFDDVDGRHDSADKTLKKIEIMTNSIIPAGSPDVVIIFIQNLLIPDGVMAQVADGRAEFLLDRKISGPYKAVDNLVMHKGEDGKWLVIDGQPTWEAGFPKEIIDWMINDMGPSAFLRECQHEVDKTGGMYDHIEFEHLYLNQVPELLKTVVIVDPAVTSHDGSDSMGIIVDGLGMDNLIYRIWAWESITSPLKAIKNAIIKAVQFKAREVMIETDQGGDTWKSVWKEAVRELIKEGRIRKDQVPRMIQDKAGSGHGPKIHRGHQMLAEYELGRFVHVIGTHYTMEKSLRRFPKKPLDLADAMWWGWYFLVGKTGKVMKPRKLDWYGKPGVESDDQSGSPQRSHLEVEEMLKEYGN